MLVIVTTGIVVADGNFDCLREPSINSVVNSWLGDVLTSRVILLLEERVGKGVS